MLYLFFMKIFFSFLFSFFSVVAFTQQKFDKELTFINDNDLYISTSQDRYYTNGMFLSYHYVSSKNSTKSDKKIYGITLGHEIYTPFKAVVNDVTLHDRPFASHVFAGFSIQNFYKNNSIFRFETQLGVLGPSSYGEELMGIIHDIYGFKDAVGWKYQISDALALSFKGTYIKLISRLSSSAIDLNWKSTLSIGTIYNYVSTGLYSRVGVISLQNTKNSLAFKGHLNNVLSESTTKKEVFFYINPMLRYVAHDATIQGSFLNNNSTVTYSINPVIFTSEFGIRFTLNRIHFGYSATYHSKKLKSFRVPNGNFYGSIQLNYLFR